MITVIEGIFETDYIVDFHGNDREYIDIYNEATNQNLFDLTDSFHGKKVKITIQEIS